MFCVRRILFLCWLVLVCRGPLDFFCVCVARRALYAPSLIWRGRSMLATFDYLAPQVLPLIKRRRAVLAAFGRLSAKRSALKMRRRSVFSAFIVFR